MLMVYPGDTVSLDVVVYGAGGNVESAVLSAATLTAGGHSVAATVSGQTLTATLPIDLALGAASLVWAWTQVAGGITSAQTLTQAATVVVDIADEPDYTAAPGNPSKAFYVGETRLIKWIVTRDDSFNVDLPSAAALTLTLPNGSTQSLALLCDETAPANSLTFGSVITFGVAGCYKAVMQITVNAQTIEAAQLLVVSYP